MIRMVRANMKHMSASLLMAVHGNLFGCLLWACFTLCQVTGIFSFGWYGLAAFSGISSAYAVTAYLLVTGRKLGLFLSYFTLLGLGGWIFIRDYGRYFDACARFRREHGY